MAEWLVILMSYAHSTIDGMEFLAMATAAAMATWAFRHTGYRRHVRRIAEIEHRIALRAGSAA